MRRFIGHHHEIAFLVNQLAPADVSLQNQALLVIAVTMGWQACARFHPDQHRCPAGFRVFEQRFQVDPRHSRVNSLIVIAAYIGPWL